MYLDRPIFSNQLASEPTVYWFEPENSFYEFQYLGLVWYFDDLSEWHLLDTSSAGAVTRSRVDRRLKRISDHISKRKHLYLIYTFSFRPFTPCMIRNSVYTRALVTKLAKWQQRWLEQSQHVGASPGGWGCWDGMRFDSANTLFSFLCWFFLAQLCSQLFEFELFKSNHYIDL